MGRSRASLGCAIAFLCVGLVGPSHAAPESLPGSLAEKVSNATTDVDREFLLRAREHIAEREYWASHNGVGLQAPNRAHNLRTYFEPAGIEVHSRTESTANALLALRLISIARGTSQITVGPGEVRSERGRVEIHRPNLVEWYVNTHAGLEQGFTLNANPREGEGSLVLALDVSGARASAGVDEVLLSSKRGRQLHYGHLVARDASGRELESRFRVASEHTIQLVVDDKNATYPIIIDPLLTTTADLQLAVDFSLDPVFDRKLEIAELGLSYDAAGDVNGDGYGDMIVGAWAFEPMGAVFIFMGGPRGLNGLPATVLTGHTPIHEVSFGFGITARGIGDVNGDGFDDVSVSSPFNCLIFGSPDPFALIYHGASNGVASGGIETAHTRIDGHGCRMEITGIGDVNGDGYGDVGARTGVGLAVYHGGPGGIPSTVVGNQDATLQVAQFQRAGDINGDGYGDLVFCQPIYAVVTDGSNARGAAFIVWGSPTGFPEFVTHETLPFFAFGDAEHRYIGWDIATGDVNGDGFDDVALGAPSAGVGFDAVFVFHGKAQGFAAGGLAGADTRIASPTGIDPIDFGTAIDIADIDGDGYGDLLVEAPKGNPGFDGRVFRGGPQGIEAESPANADGHFQLDEPSGPFGGSIRKAGDLNGDGSDDFFFGTQRHEYLSRSISIFMGPSGSQLGASVDGAGDVNGDGRADVIVGAPGYDDGAFETGAAFVFDGSLGGTSAPAIAHLGSSQRAAHMGESVAGAGDVNGDGYSDVIVGLPGHLASGRANVYHGGPNGIADRAAPSSVVDSSRLGASFGLSVDGAGDVNGDGFSDVIVGSPFYSPGGAAFVFHGGAQGIGPPVTDLDADGRFVSDQAGANVGWSVAGAGDVNGDGGADVLIGAPLYDAPLVDEGAAFLLHGMLGGVGDRSPANADGMIVSQQAGVKLGNSLDGAGDVNGDGYADVIVGEVAEPEAPPASRFSGRAYVFHGQPGGITNANPANANGRLRDVGASVAGAGDVNGDGFADVIVGERFYDDGDEVAGSAYVFFGSAVGVGSGSAATADARIVGDEAGANLGVTVAGAGDMNGDGYAEVIVGAPYYDSVRTDEGTAFVYYGGSTGIPDTTADAADRHFSTNQQDAELGTSVAGAGDVNGDGFWDVILGAPQFDGGVAGEGAAFFYVGAAGGPLLAAQIEGNNTNAQMGASVAGAGDINGDGYGEVIVGAPTFLNVALFPPAPTGAAFVFYGNGTAQGISAQGASDAGTRIVGTQPSASFGHSVAGLGDTNGDGLSEIAIGAPDHDGEGAAFVFYGDASGIPHGAPSNADVKIEPGQSGAQLGHALAGAGDVDSDGYAELIVGAPAFSNGQENEGAAFVFHGSPTGLIGRTPAEAAAFLESDDAGALFGYSVDSAGDTSGDGFGDVIVGAPQYTDTHVFAGGAFVFEGSEGGLAGRTPATAAAKFISDQPLSSFGWSVAGIGDAGGHSIFGFDAGGVSDVAVGAPRYTTQHDREGSVFVFRPVPGFGLSDGTPASAATQIRGNQELALLGYSIAGAGDVNGDGFADLLAGAPKYDDGENDEGAAFLFHGNGSGRAFGARQLRDAGGQVPVTPWGRSGSEDAIHVSALGSLPSGRGGVRLEVEACPLGVPFTIDTQAECAQAVTPASPIGPAQPFPVLEATVDGLTPDTLYRWRARLHYDNGVFARPSVTPAHGPWRRFSAQSHEADLRMAAGPDSDGDGVPDGSDNCPTVANGPLAGNDIQLDTDGDDVGDVCDNCIQFRNPRLGENGSPVQLPFQTATGGQLDDDADGFGNHCDAKFTIGGQSVGGLDLAEITQSFNRQRAASNCGSSGSRACAEFDLDNRGQFISAGDLSRSYQLFNSLPGPKCDGCPLECVGPACL